MKAFLYQPYRMYPYERRFLRAEVHALGGRVRVSNGTGTLVDGLSMDDVQELTYVHEFRNGLPKKISTRQATREGLGSRQNTTYGPHGLHEYRGKFNPQTPRSLLVQQRLQPGDVVLDPFCGSGTTLVEATLLGKPSIGIELHPLAAFLSRAKIAWLQSPEAPAPEEGEIRKASAAWFDAPTRQYLERWFPERILKDLERCLVWTEQLQAYDRQVALALLSNLLREHSLQDPRDLRIRRRSSVPAGKDLVRAFSEALRQEWPCRLRWGKGEAQQGEPAVEVITGSSTDLRRHLGNREFMATVTSPPYATALPYADTYRLSNVVLGLVPPDELGVLDRSLAGSRDIGHGDREAFEKRLAVLPPHSSTFVEELQAALESDPKAGFRKQAVPFALARYLEVMQTIMEEIHTSQADGGKNAWVVGPNRTTVGGQEMRIDTPAMLCEIADFIGFNDAKLEPLDTYARYDVHSRNSIRSESLFSFRR